MPIILSRSSYSRERNVLKADGFDKAVIGKAYDVAVQESRLVYSVEKCIEILIKKDGTLGPYLGNDGPIFVENWKHDATNNR